MQKYLRIIYCVTICLVIGFLSGKVTQSSISTWYPTLQKPSFNPLIGFLLPFGLRFIFLWALQQG